MPDRGHHDRLAGAHTPAPADPRTGAAHGYDPRHTLPLRVELARQLLRRRTRLCFAFLLFLPLLPYSSCFVITDNHRWRNAKHFTRLINYFIEVYFICDSRIYCSKIAYERD